MTNDLMKSSSQSKCARILDVAAFHSKMSLTNTDLADLRPGWLDRSKDIATNQIGSGAIIGAGGSVVCSAPSSTTVYAVPAKRLAVHRSQSDEK